MAFGVGSSSGRARQSWLPCKHTFRVSSSLVLVVWLVMVVRNMAAHFRHHHVDLRPRRSLSIYPLVADQAVPDDCYGPKGCMPSNVGYKTGRVQNAQCVLVPGSFQQLNCKPVRFLSIKLSVGNCDMNNHVYALAGSRCRKAASCS